MPPARESIRRLAILALVCGLVASLPAAGFPQSPGRSLDTVQERFAPPPGYVRMVAAPGSFAGWLRALPLLPENSPVRDYRGRIRRTAKDTAVAAVLALDIRGQKLQQCMDVLIRLRAEYLWQAGRAAEIAFLLPDRTRLAWRDWARGLRPHRQGGSFPLRRTAEAGGGLQAFRAYLDTIFYSAYTQTYYFGLAPVRPEDVQAGDVLIKKSRKGHAVLLLDVARNAAGHLCALVAQGDTPACQVHILRWRQGQVWVPLDFSAPAPDLPIRKKMPWAGLRRLE